MLSITKIVAAANQPKSKAGKGYLHYLGEPSKRQRGDFDDYARGDKPSDGPAPFWACKGPALLGLDQVAEAEHVERLAKGFHPVTGAPLVIGAGEAHVMGLDMTFSAPKDFSAVFAGADAGTRAALIECLKDSAREALSFAEAQAVTRHGHAGRIKQVAEAAIAACYTHFASRSNDPQLHVHAFLFNVGKREQSEEWSALEHRPQFESKMATGILFRVELAHRLGCLGFDVIPAGPYFAIQGITEAQREALSTRSRQIAQYMQEAGLEGMDDTASREIAALNTRAAKAEPPLKDLLAGFEKAAAALGITPASVSAMRTAHPTPDEPLVLDHQAILDGLMESQSCATAQEALAVICEQVMGRWSAQECLAELERFMAHANVVQLGHTELLTRVFTSKATKQLEERIHRVTLAGTRDHAHKIAPTLVDAQFNALERELRARLGVAISLSQQRRAALHIASESGRQAFVEGWAGTGKTTMLKALGAAYRGAGMTVVGCCQSAAAAQNLARETDIPSRTIASLLLSLRQGRSKLGPKTILVLDEAGMVGSSEYALLQEEAMEAGAKLVCVGDPKQLQPIGAGGIFGSLMRNHGRAEISNIQRQRTDFEPLLAWLDARASRAGGGLSPQQAKALRFVPEDVRIITIEAVCALDAKLSRAFARWRSRYDFEWMREVVEMFAKGEALPALQILDAKGRLKLISGPQKAFEALIEAWAADKTPLASKTIVAATRAEVAELSRLARAHLVSTGAVADHLGIDIEIIHRDDTTVAKRFAPGDRIVFTKNDKALGVSNGVSGWIQAVKSRGSEPQLTVVLDDENERGETEVIVPASFGRFDHAYCLTNHKAQGRTFDAAYVLANPSMSDREWTYVAASRSRFATTMFVNAAALGLVDAEAHDGLAAKRHSRANVVEALASRMRRSRAKETTLDYDMAQPAPPTPSLFHIGKDAALRAFERLRQRRQLIQ